MADGLGVTFQPGSVDPQRLRLGGPPQGGSLSPQAIVKMLSLRIPKQAAPGQIAAPALLQSQGGGGLNTIMQALMQAFAPQYGGPGHDQTARIAQPGIPPAVPPIPRIIPGGGGGGIDGAPPVPVTGPPPPLDMGMGGDLAPPPHPWMGKEPLDTNGFQF